ncbi:MAG: bifunctional precorrin-2 dehydrogenase/sirohydrochlorin ferrochelatase [Spirosomataceae bacterium]
MNTLFPLFVKLDLQHILLVGGGYVALEKLTAIFENCPETHITLVAPEIRAEIREMASQYAISLHEKPFDSSFLEGKNLVFVATNDKMVNLQISEECRQRKILVNVADTPLACDFYLSSIVRKGDLKIGISTNGKSPTLAKRIKELLTVVLPDTIQETLDNLVAIRETLRGDFESKVKQLNEITKVMRKD